MALTLRHLEIFHAIVKTGSVTAAARDLHITQPAVSAVLKHMEQRLQYRLFERIGGRLKLTPEAEALVPDLYEIFGRIDTLDRVAENMRDGLAGRLVVASTPTLVDTLLPQAIARFRLRHHGVSVAVRSLPTPLAIQRVARREVDMGLVYGPVEDASVEAEELASSGIACVVPLNHRLASQHDVHPADLAAESIISVNPLTHLGRAIERHFAAAGVPPLVIGIEPSSSLTACLMVREGAGVALVDRSAALSGAFGDLAFRPLNPPIGISIQLIYPHDRPRSRAGMQLAQALRQATGALPP
jgi:molybdate transport repressor ModE-like protein